MSPTLCRRSLKLGRRSWFAATLLIVLLAPFPRAGAGLGGRHTDPAQVVPLDQLAAEYREAVAEVISEHTFHRQGESENFPCHSSLYLSLLAEPLVPLTLWKDLMLRRCSFRKSGPTAIKGPMGPGRRRSGTSCSALLDFISSWLISVT